MANGHKLMRLFQFALLLVLVLMGGKKFTNFDFKQNRTITHFALAEKDASAFPPLRRVGVIVVLETRPGREKDIGQIKSLSLTRPSTSNNSKRNKKKTNQKTYSATKLPRE